MNIQYEYYIQYNSYEYKAKQCVLMCSSYSLGPHCGTKLFGLSILYTLVIIEKGSFLRTCQMIPPVFLVLKHSIL